MDDIDRVERSCGETHGRQVALTANGGPERWGLLTNDWADEKPLQFALRLALTAMLGREGRRCVSPAHLNDDLRAAGMRGDPRGEVVGVRVDSSPAVVWGAVPAYLGHGDATDLARGRESGGGRYCDCATLSERVTPHRRGAGMPHERCHDDRRKCEQHRRGPRNPRDDRAARIGVTAFEPHPDGGNHDKGGREVHQDRAPVGVILGQAHVRDESLTALLCKHSTGSTDDKADEGDEVEGPTPSFEDNDEDEEECGHRKHDHHEVHDKGV